LQQPANRKKERGLVMSQVGHQREQKAYPNVGSLNLQGSQVVFFCLLKISHRFAKSCKVVEAMSRLGVEGNGFLEDSSGFIDTLERIREGRGSRREILFN
jgi:hypothetical protein